MEVNCSFSSLKWALHGKQWAVMSGGLFLVPHIWPSVFSPARERRKTIWIVIRYLFSLVLLLLPLELTLQHEGKFIMCLRLGLLLRACEAGGRGLCRINYCFLKKQLHMRPIFNAAIINPPFFGSPLCKTQFHPYLSSKPAVCLPGNLSCSLSCLSPSGCCTLMLLFASHYWRAAGIISLTELHGHCMAAWFTVLCMVKVCWLQNKRNEVGFEVCWLLRTLWLPQSELLNFQVGCWVDVAACEDILMCVCMWVSCKGV